jgi:acyl carrier protein
VRIDEGTSFLDTGLIDSTGVLELVDFLEEQFGIAVEDSELVPENLDSISNLSRYLVSKGVPAAGN